MLLRIPFGPPKSRLHTDIKFAGWAEVLLADGPRQAINAITLYSVLQAKLIPGVDTKGISGLLSNIQHLANEDTTQAVILCAMLFTLVLWVWSFMLLCLSGILWLLFAWHHIPEGYGLSSFCAEKIDKRLKEVVAKNHKKIVEEDQKKRQDRERKGL